jgi:hypothetical protein
MNRKGQRQKEQVQHAQDFTGEENDGQEQRDEQGALDVRNIQLVGLQHVAHQPCFAGVQGPNLQLPLIVAGLSGKARR